MQADKDRVRLAPMTEEMYRAYFREYENDPDLLLPGQEYVRYEYSDEKVAKYVKRQKELGRIPLAVLYGEETVGEILIKNIENHESAEMSIALKNRKYKDRGIGTEAERLAVRYVFDRLDIRTLYADTVKSNKRSRHVLEKTGFAIIREDDDFVYYRIERLSDRTDGAPSGVPERSER